MLKSPGLRTPAQGPAPGEVLGWWSAAAWWTLFRMHVTAELGFLWPGLEGQSWRPVPSLAAGALEARESPCSPRGSEDSGGPPVAGYEWLCLFP